MLSKASKSNFNDSLPVSNNSFLYLLSNVSICASVILSMYFNSVNNRFSWEKFVNACDDTLTQ